MKKILKKVIALASAVAMTLSMSSFVSAAEDIVLEDSGSPFIKTFDPGDKGDYIYLGYAYCFEVEAGSGDSNGEETKKEDENKNVEIVTDNAKNTSTGTVGSVKPGASGVPVWTIAAGVGGVVVAAVAFGITKSKKK